jgi:predicted regulator of Ras-like GTPase activity (Roadblock/LC7/MglB family)
MESLEGILARLVAEVPSASLAALGSMDGLVVEQHPPAGRDLAGAAAEVTNVLVGVGRAFGRHLGLGAAHELTVSADGALAVVRVVTPELYLLVVLEGSGDVGRTQGPLDDAARAVRDLLA